MFSLIDEYYFTSGFIPRFIVMRGHGDVSRVRPTGPPRPESLNKKDALQSTFQAYYNMYTNQQVQMVLPDGQTMITTPDIDVQFTCLLYTSPSPRDRQKSRMPSSA